MANEGETGEAIKLQALSHHASFMENPESAKELARRLSRADFQKVQKFVERRKSLAPGTRPPPDGGFGWVVVFAAFLLHIVCCGALYTLSVYFPTFLTVFDLTPTNTSWISAIFFGSFFMCGPLAGNLVEKLGTRITAFIGCLVASIGILIASFMTTYALVVFFMAFFGGIGTGCAVLASVTSTIRWFDAQRGIAMGLVAAGSGVGAAIFGPLISFLTDKYGWNGCMLIESALVFNGCIFSFFLREVPMIKYPKTAGTAKTSKNVTIQEDDEAGSTNGPTTAPAPQGKLQVAVINNTNDNKLSVPAAPARRKSMSEKAIEQAQVLRNWKFWMFAISQLLIFYALNAPYVYLINRAVHDCDIPRQQASVLVSIMGSCSIVGRLFFGTVAMKMGNYKFIPFALSMLINGVTAMLITLNNSFAVNGIYCAIVGFTYGSMICLTSMVLVDFFGISQIAKAFGNLIFFRGLGFLVGPPVGGVIVALSGGYHKVLWLSSGAVMTTGGLLVCGLPLVQKIIEWKQQRPPIID